MLNPCSPCVCTRASCEQCMFGYQSAEAKHKQMKQLIELVDRGEKPNGYLLAQRYKNYHNMNKLKKNFIGKVCETCDMLQAYTYKNLDDNGNIIINVGCVNHDICYKALEQAQKIK